MPTENEADLTSPALSNLKLVPNWGRLGQAGAGWGEGRKELVG